MYTNSSFKFRVSSFKSSTSEALPANFNPETLDLKRREERGISLIELIVFMVVVGAAVAGVLIALNQASKGSADPMIEKRALAIAEAMLEEVQLMPFTYCDPDDANAESALNAGACAATAEGIGPEGVDAPPTGPAETRTGTVRAFDNVNDYHGFFMNGITDIDGAAIAGLGAYRADVTVAAQALGTIPSSDSQLITVTVTWPISGPTSVTVSLQGYRVRYAPNALP